MITIVKVEGWRELLYSDTVIASGERVEEEGELQVIRKAELSPISSVS